MTFYGITTYSVVNHVHYLGSNLVDVDSNKVYDELLKKSYLLPENGHNVVIIQPRKLHVVSLFRF